MVEDNNTVDSETLHMFMMTSDDCINLGINYSNGTELWIEYD